MSDGKTKNFLGLRLIFSLTTLLGFLSTSYGTPAEVILNKPNPTLLRGGLVFSMENKAGPINVNQDIYQVTRTISTDSLVKGLQATYDSYYQYRDHCKKIAEYIQRVNGQTPASPPPPREYSQQDMGNWVSRPIDGWKLQHTATKQRLLGAPSVCLHSKGRLPEVHTKEQKDKLRSYMNVVGIYRTYAGVYYDTKTGAYRYSSDDSIYNYDVMNRISYGGSWETWDLEVDIWDGEAQKQARTHAIVYADPEGNFRMRILKDSDHNAMEHIICEVRDDPPPEPEREEKMSMMISMAHHACLRDEQTLKDKTEGQRLDIEKMMKIKFSINSTNSVLPNLVPINFYDWEDKRSRRNLEETDLYMMTSPFELQQQEQLRLPGQEDQAHQDQQDQAHQDQRAGQEEQRLAEGDQQQENKTAQLMQSDVWNKLMRDKRAIPAGVPLMVAGGAANVIYSLVEGGAPLSWTGDMIGSIFGWASASEVKTIKKNMVDQGKSIKALQFNQEQIDKVVKNVIDEVENTTKELIEIVLSTQTGIAMKAAEEDLKGINRQLTTNNDITLLRFANILTSTRAGKASPFVITSEELEELAVKAKEEKAVTLDTNLDNIRVMMTLIDNDLQLFFDIPVKNEDRLFTFFKVIALPQFMSNATLIPRLDAPYLAISVANSEYHTVDADEFNRCIDTPHLCTVASPVIPLTESAHCVVKTYTTSQISCILEETNIPRRPFIRSIGNHTVFSVPEDTNLFVKCTNPWTVGHNQDTNIVIKGVGDMTFRPGCQVTLPDGSKWDTPDISPQVQMKTNLPLHSPYNTLPLGTNVTVEYFKPKDIQRPQIIYVNQPVEQEDLDTVEEIVTEAFTNKNTLVPFMLRTGATIMTILLLSFLCVWIYISCRVYCSGHPWCPCIKPFPEPDAELRTVKDQIQIMQNQLKSTYKNFRDTSQGLTNRLARVNPEPNVAQKNPEETGIEMTDQPQPILKNKGVTFGENGQEKL